MSKSKKFLARAFSFVLVFAMAFNTACSNTDSSTESLGESSSHDSTSSETLSESVHTHDWGEYVIVNFSCEEGGMKYRECSGCDEIDSVKIPAGHT